MSMSVQLNKKIVVAVFATFMLSACGGGGGGSEADTKVDNPPPADTKLTWDNSKWDETEWQ